MESTIQYGGVWQSLTNLSGITVNVATEKYFFFVYRLLYIYFISSDNNFHEASFSYLSFIRMTTNAQGNEEFHGLLGENFSSLLSVKK